MRCPTGSRSTSRWTPPSWPSPPSSPRRQHRGPASRPHGPRRAPTSCQRSKTMWRAPARDAASHCAMPWSSASWRSRWSCSSPERCSVEVCWSRATPTLGSTPMHVAMLAFNLQMNGYDEERAVAFRERAVQALRALPGVSPSRSRRACRSRRMSTWKASGSRGIMRQTTNRRQLTPSASAPTTSTSSACPSSQAGGSRPMTKPRGAASPSSARRWPGSTGRAVGGRPADLSGRFRQTRTGRRCLPRPQGALGRRGAAPLSAPARSGRAASPWW